MKRKTKQIELPPPPVSQIETFYDPRGWGLSQMIHDEPSCFNRKVAIRRYRVTVEEIEEPKEVLAERLRKLWIKCDNHHHWELLQRVAKGLGVELDPKEFGKERKP